MCLRKGCGREFLAHSWNHRFCHDPECARELARWNARKRQQRRRENEEVRAAHRDEERERRAAARAAAKTASNPKEVDPGRASRGHAAEGVGICDRPGCFEVPVKAPCGQTRYCCAECRTAVRRVMDRERKWLGRLTRLGRFKRKREYERVRERRRKERARRSAAGQRDR
jgi:hypothetical protein